MAGLAFFCYNTALKLNICYWGCGVNSNLKRCSWCLSSQLYRDYHDNEWGEPVHDEQKHFEFLLLETMQAGLSWITILNRREDYCKAFANFDPNIVASYDKNKINQLMNNSSIIRNLKKIESAVNNANKFLEIQNNSGFGSFDNYIWSFTNGKVIKNSWQDKSEIPTTTDLSDKVSKDLKQRGFKFIGSITTYAHLQAIGVVNDHVADCFKSSLP